MRWVIGFFGQSMLATGRQLFSGGFRPEILARAAVMVNLILVILLAHRLAALTWELVPPPPLPHAAERPAGAAPAQRPDRIAANFATIAGWHLFGEVQAAAPAPAPAVVKAPETRLNLKLTGIYYGEGGSLALIAAGSGKAEIYAPGDPLPGGVRVESIRLDHVVLSRGGQLEKLSLPHQSGQPGNGAALPPALAPEPAGIAGSGGVVDASVIAGSLREELAADPRALQRIAFATPYLQNGQFVGFRLRAGRDRRLLAQLGLQTGDVITAINGARLEDPAQGLALLQDLLHSDQVSVQVLRGGVEIPLTFIIGAR